MNRSAIVLIVLLLVIVALFRFCNSNPESDAGFKQNPLGISKNSGTFNQSFNALLFAYYALKDAFIAGDTVKINSASIQVQAGADSLNVNEIQGDSTGMIKETARSFAITISSSAVAIRAEKDLEAGRKELNVITDALWSLTRTVEYAGQKIYYHYCPMAFNNQGAYWLSDSRKILNPYFGNKMLKCGEIRDSIDYSQR